MSLCVCGKREREWFEHVRVSSEGVRESLCVFVCAREIECDCAVCISARVFASVCDYGR